MQPDNPPTTEEHFKIIKRAFGNELLAYALNLDDTDVDLPALQGDGVRLDALNAIVSYLEGLRAEAFHRGYPLGLVAHRLGIVPGVKDNLLSQIRRELGGDTPQLTSQNPIVEALSPIVGAVYPYLLSCAAFAREERGLPARHAFAYFAHRSDAERFNAAINDDPVLGPALGGSIASFSLDAIDNDSVNAHVAVVRDNFGSGGSFQGTTLPTHLIDAAYLVARIRGQLTIPGLGSALEEAVSVLASGFSPDGAETPVFVGVEGFDLEGDTTIDLPWGSIRSAPKMNDLIRPFSGLVAESPQRPRFEHHHGGGGVVMELSAALRYTLVEAPAAESQQADRQYRQDVIKQWQHVQRELRTKLDLTALAVLLALGPARAAGFDVAWSIAFNPLRIGGLSGRSMSQWSSVVLTAQEAADLEYWAQLLDAPLPTEVGFAGRRAISAAFERSSADDKLVDAVMGWEALFGADTEVTFRVTAAMALLLEQDPEGRSDRQKQLATIYATRSKVVHGGFHKGSEALGTQANEAVEALVECLRILLTDRSDLLEDRTRSRTLLLRA